MQKVHTAHKTGTDPHMETSPNGYCSHFGTEIRPDLSVSMVFSAALFVFFTVYFTKMSSAN